MIDILILTCTAIFYLSPCVYSHDNDMPRYHAYAPGVPVTVHEYVRKENVYDTGGDAERSVPVKVKRVEVNEYPPGIPRTFYEQREDDEADLETDEEEEEEEDDEGVVGDFESVFKPLHKHTPSPQPPVAAPQQKREENNTTSNNETESESEVNHTRSILESSHVMGQSDREHLAQHLDVPLDTSEMTNLELAFHYFKIHDNDENRMLDGIELIKYMIHQHNEQENHNTPEGETKPERIFGEDELIEAVEHILAEDDLNKDGFISAYEFLKSFEKQQLEHERRQKEAARKG